MIIIVIGVPCSGKTTAGRHLARQHGFAHIEASSVLILAAQQYGHSGATKAELASALFASQGMDAIEQHAIAVGMMATGHRIVYTGVRTVEGLVILLEYANSTGIAAFVFSVETDMQLAIARSVSRARDSQASAAGYQERLRINHQYGVLRYANIVSDWKIVNTGKKGKFLRSVDLATHALASGHIRTDDSMWTELISAGPSGDVNGLVSDPVWLANEHPDLIDGRVLSSRGKALYRIYSYRHAK